MSLLELGVFENTHTHTPLLPGAALVFTWDKHVDFRLVDLLRLSFLSPLRMFVGAGVIPGVLHRRVVNEERRRVVSRENEGVCRQGLHPDHVPFAGAADVQDGTGQQDELLLVGDDGGRRQSGGD